MRTKPWFLISSLILVAVFVLSGCQPERSSIPTLTPTTAPSPTATSHPLPTGTPSPSEALVVRTPSCVPSPIVASPTPTVREAIPRGRILFTLIDEELWRKLDRGTETPIPRDLWIIHVDGTGQRRWIDDGRYKDQPFISPDRSQIAYLAYTLEEGGQRQKPSLWVANIDGSQPRRVDPLLQEGVQPGQWGKLIGWSPNGEWLAYIMYPEDDPYLVDEKSLHAVHVPTGRTMVILDAYATSIAAWNPIAESVLAFCKSINPDVVYEVDMEHPQGVHQVEGVTGNWIPDGRLFWIDEKGNLTIAYADGTPLRTIIMPEYYRLWWSPNGRWCAYTASLLVKFRGEEHYLEELYVMGDEGRNRRNLITHQQFDLRFMPVVWSPDSAWLAGFGVPPEHVNELGYSDYTGRLYIVNIHTGKLITLTENLQPQPTITSMVWIQ